ncbi:hypothetical protein [Silvibacterium acidisoli]|uniref:hypothetical protein n=1 Tax=Acidobacteriaceae bacterium ZG23-2 TaxID=2883246 RepID=UPI00406C0A8F
MAEKWQQYRRRQGDRGSRREPPVLPIRFWNYGTNDAILPAENVSGRMCGRRKNLFQKNQTIAGENLRPFTPTLPSVV